MIALWSKVICFSSHLVGAEHIRVLICSWAMEFWWCVRGQCSSGNESWAARLAWCIWRVFLRAQPTPVPGDWFLDAQLIMNHVISSALGNVVKAPAVLQSRCPHGCMPGQDRAAPAGWWVTPTLLAALTATLHWSTQIPTSHLILIISKACICFSFSERKSHVIWLFVWAQVAQITDWCAWWQMNIFSSQEECLQGVMAGAELALYQGASESPSSLLSYEAVLLQCTLLRDCLNGDKVQVALKLWIIRMSVSGQKASYYLIFRWKVNTFIMRTDFM